MVGDVKESSCDNQCPIDFASSIGNSITRDVCISFQELLIRIFKHCLLFAAYANNFNNHEKYLK